VTSETDGFLLQDGYLFQICKLCIPRTSLELPCLEIACWKSCWSFWLRKDQGCGEYITLASLKKDVAKLIGQCRTCQLAKQRKQNTGVYTPLHVPDRPWQDLSMNFVLGLSKTIRKHDSIFVVVNRFSKMAHFLSCTKTSDASKIAQIYFDGMAKLHCLPKTIVSDRVLKFISYFWKTLWHKMGTKVKLSTAFHLQTNGQTKMLNRSLGNLL